MISKLFFICVFAVAALILWDQPGLHETVNTLFPTLPTWAPPFAGLVLFGIVVSVMNRLTRRKPAVKADSAKKDMSLEELYSGLSNRIDKQTDTLRAANAEALAAMGNAQKAKLTEQIELVKSFDASLAEKVPHLLGFIETVNKIDWPNLEVNFDSDDLDTLQGIVKLLMTVGSVDLSKAKDNLDALDQAAVALENLENDENGYTRDFDDLETLSNDAVRLSNSLGKLLTAEGLSNLADVKERLAAMRDALTLLHETLADNDGEPRDLAAVGESVEKLSQLMASLKAFARLMGPQAPLAAVPPTGSAAA